MSTDLAARLPADQRLRGASPTGTSSRPASRRQGAPTGSETTVEQERTDSRRFPLQPALDYMVRHGISGDTAMRRAGLNAARALKAGTLNGDQADRLAGILGLHPYELWGDSWYGFDTLGDEPPCQHRPAAPSSGCTGETAGTGVPTPSDAPRPVAAATDPGPVAIVDCLCGKAHPCPDHGQWAGQPYRPTMPRAQRQPLNGFYLLRLLEETDRRGHHHQHHEEAI